MAKEKGHVMKTVPTVKTFRILWSGDVPYEGSGICNGQRIGTSATEIADDILTFMQKCGCQMKRDKRGARNATLIAVGKHDVNFHVSVSLISDAKKSGG
jgi:hypothetical protein